MRCPNANDEQCRHPDCNCHGFKPFEPRNLGNYVDVPSADERALNAVQEYINSLKEKITQLELLQDSMANMILDLINIVRDGKVSDSDLAKLAKVEDFVRKM